MFFFCFIEKQFSKLSRFPLTTVFQRENDWVYYEVTLVMCLFVTKIAAIHFPLRRRNFFSFINIQSVSWRLWLLCDEIKRLPSKWEDAFDVNSQLAHVKIDCNFLLTFAELSHFFRIHFSLNHRKDVIFICF